MTVTGKFILATALLLAASADFAAAPTTDNHADAIVRLLNSGSAGSPRGYAAAVKAVAADVEQGKALQMYVLALMNDDPLIPKELKLSDEQRSRYLEQSRPRILAYAEKTNNALAWYLVSYDRGDTNLLKRASDGGNVQALNAWGMKLVDEADAPRPGEPPSPALAEAFACFDRAAGMGDANGLYNLGMCYARGIGAAVDDHRAISCFRSAAEKGHPQAINNLGWFFLAGRGVEEDHAIAARWFAKSAEYGNPVGQLNYGLALQSGDGVPRDEVKAAEQFARAAEQKNLDAMNVYGVCLCRGTGVKKDCARALELFRAAAAAGFPPAMDNIASCYERGDGVEKSAEQALLWRMRARALRGDPEAEKWLEANGGRGDVMNGDAK